MQRFQILLSLVKIPLDMVVVFFSFFVAGWIRSHGNFIPYVHLPIQTIPESQLFLFAVMGVVLWVTIFSIRGLYRVSIEISLFSEIRRITSDGLQWFLIYIGVVYLSSGFLFSYEIPRLVILYAYILAFLTIVLSRLLLDSLYRWLARSGSLTRYRIGVIGRDQDFDPPESDLIEYQDLSVESPEKIRELLRSRSIDILLYLDPIQTTRTVREYVELCKIYGIRFAYPKVAHATEHIPQRESFIAEIPVMEASAVTIEPIERVMKRIFDIVISLSGLIILSPLLLLIAFLIWVEDPSGPVIFRNRRIGIGGSEFDLYKFRYMYWRDSVKDAYGITSEHDPAFLREQELRMRQNTRSGPVYKIQNDPRKTRVGRIIERLSLDEPPQLVNVLIGNMSLVGPRPHQPREVENYEEYQYQVLTVKPGITGMAQVNGREKNNFEDEVLLDTYYIEHYSLGLDFLILAKTVGVVLMRGFR